VCSAVAAALRRAAWFRAFWSRADQSGLMRSVVITETSLALRDVALLLLLPAALPAPAVPAVPPSPMLAEAEERPGVRFPPLFKLLEEDIAEPRFVKAAPPAPPAPGCEWAYTNPRLKGGGS
jgi:hypothetical protein